MNEIRINEGQALEERIISLLKGFDVDEAIEGIIREFRENPYSKEDAKKRPFTSIGFSLNASIKEVHERLLQQCLEFLKKHDLEKKEIEKKTEGYLSSWLWGDILTAKKRIEVFVSLYPIKESNLEILTECSLQELTLICYGINPKFGRGCSVVRGKDRAMYLREGTDFIFSNLSEKCLSEKCRFDPVLDKLDKAIKSGKLRVNSGALLYDNLTGHVVDTRKVVWSDFIEWVNSPEIQRIQLYIHEETRKMFDIVDYKKEYEKIKEENKQLEKENEKLKEDVDVSPRIVDEKLLAYFFINKDTDLEREENWVKYMNGSSEKGTLLQRMKTKGLGIDRNSLEAAIKRANERYLKSKQQK
jgi:hypothetical protein